MGTKSEDLRIRIAPHLRRKLKAIASVDGESESAVVRAAVLSYLSIRESDLSARVEERPPEPGKIINTSASGGHKTAIARTYRTAIKRASSH